MGQERLNGLAMLYYHRDVQITTEVVDEFARRQSRANVTDLTTSPDCLLNYNHYDVICHVINVYIYRKLAPIPPPPPPPPPPKILDPPLAAAYLAELKRKTAPPQT